MGEKGDAELKRRYGAREESRDEEKQDRGERRD